MRITLMHNPKAGDAEHGEKQLMTALAKAGHHATYQSTKKSDYKKALKKPTDLVLAAGGDGTVGKIGSRLIDSGIPLSVLPLGTANNLARSLGFIASPEEIIGRLEGGKKHAFDVGLARGPSGKRFFFESVGGGLLADHVSAANRKAKNKKAFQRTGNDTTCFTFAPHVARVSDTGMEDRHRWRRCFRPIYSLGSHEHSFDRSGALSRLAGRDQGWPARFRVRARKRSLLLMDHLDARLAGKKPKFPLPIRRFRKLQVVWEGSSKLHLDDKLWPRKKQESNSGKLRSQCDPPHS